MSRNNDAPIAQWIEHLPSKQRVAGSSPAGRTLYMHLWSSGLGNCLLSSIRWVRVLLGVQRNVQQIVLYLKDHFQLNNSEKRETHKALRCCQGLALSYGTSDIKRTRSFFSLKSQLTNYKLEA